MTQLSFKVFASASFPVVVIKRSGGRGVGGNQLKEERLSVGSQFQVMVPYCGEGKEAGR